MSLKGTGICSLIVQVSLLGALLFFKNVHSGIRASDCKKIGDGKSVLEPIDRECRRYSTCHYKNGRWTIIAHDCVPGFVFIEEIQDCVPGTHENCPTLYPPPTQPPTEAPPPTEEPTPPPTPAPPPGLIRPPNCSTVTVDDCKVNGHIPELCDTTCRVYYYCEYEDEEWDFYRLICDYGFAFSLDDDACVRDTSVICPRLLQPPPPPPEPSTPAPEPEPTPPPGPTLPPGERCVNGIIVTNNEWPCKSALDALGEELHYYYKCYYDNELMGWKRRRVDCPRGQCSGQLGQGCHFGSFFSPCYKAYRVDRYC